MEKSILQEQLNRYHELWCDATQLYEKWAKQRGITYNYVLVLCTLLNHPLHCTQKIIAQKWGVPKQTINTILKDLQNKGYVILTHQPSDNRNKLILLTDNGMQYAKEIEAALTSLDTYAIEKMGLERMKFLNDNLADYLKYFRKAEHDQSVL